MLQLFKVLIGCKPNGRHTEQHDVFFGIANSLQELVPQLKDFWPEAAHKMHLDAFTTINYANGYEISIVPKTKKIESDTKLFFINLGGYKPNEFEEYHYKTIIAAPTITQAIQIAKQTTFYKHTGFASAPSHIDDKYGIDVDDVYEIEDILPIQTKKEFTILLKKADKILQPEPFQLGYFKLSKIEKGDYTPD